MIEGHSNFLMFSCFEGLGKGRRFRLADQPQGRGVQSPQLRLRWFILRKFYEIALLEKFAEAVLLIGSQEVRIAQFVQKFLRGPVRGVECEGFFEVLADCVRDGSAERVRIIDDSRSGLEPAAGANMRR